MASGLVSFLRDGLVSQSIIRVGKAVKRCLLFSSVISREIIELGVAQALNTLDYNVSVTPIYIKAIRGRRYSYYEPGT